MGKQIIWEFRKSVCRPSFLILLSLVLALLSGLTLQSIFYYRDGLPNWGYGEEYQTLFKQYEGCTSEEFATIKAEQEALRQAYPEHYTEVSKDSEGNDFLASTPLGWAQDRLLQILHSPDNIINSTLYPYLPMNVAYVTEHGEELDALIAASPDTYGARLLTKQKQWLSSNPNRTILVYQGGSAYPTNGLTDTVGNGILIPLLTCFLILLACAPLYSREYRSDTDALLLTTKQGARRSLRAKCATAALLGGGIAVLLQLFSLLIQSFFYSFPWDASFASLSEYSSQYSTGYVGLSIGQVFWIFFGLRVLGSAALGLLVGLLSSCSKNVLVPVGVGAFLFLYPFVLNSLPTGYYETIPQIIETAGQGMPEVFDWLTTASVSGAQSAGFLGVWFAHYLNFFGYPVSRFWVAATASLMIILLSLLAPRLFRRHSGGGRHLKKEVSHAYHRKHHQAI